MRGNGRKEWRTPVTCAFVVLLSFTVSRKAMGQYLTIYGGPAYDGSTGNGYQNAANVNPSRAAFGIASVDKYIAGLKVDTHVAVRWDQFATFELGRLPGDSKAQSGPLAANAAGTIVGDAIKFVSGVNKGARPVLWDSSGAITELGNLGTDNTGFTQGYAEAINDSGLVVGHISKYVSGVIYGESAVRWNPGSTIPVELADPGLVNGGSSIQAVVVNNSGVTAGTAEKVVGSNYEGNRAIRWNASGTVATALDTIGPDQNKLSGNYPTDINSGGTIVGWVDGDPGTVDAHAVRWDPSSTAAIELGNLGTSSVGTVNSRANAINDFNAIVGRSQKFDNNGVDKGSRAVRWDAGTTIPTELGHLGTDGSGSTFADANDISNDGIVVGTCAMLGSTSDLRAVFWGPDGIAVDINTLIDPSSGWVLRNAKNINNDDWVTGIGTFDPDGAGPLAAYNRAFMIQVPEPGTMALGVFGASSMLYRRRR